MLPFRLSRFQRVLDRILDAIHAFAELTHELVAGVAEDAHHRPVVVEHEGLKLGDPLQPGIYGEMLQKKRADAASLEVVLDEERHLGDPLVALALVEEHVVPPDGDHVVTLVGHERHAILVVDVGEMAELVRGQVGLDLEEPPIDALGADPLEELVLVGSVLRLDRP